MVEPANRSAERTLALLAVVCEQGSASLSQAARQTELSVSTSLRLLRTLEATGFVRRDAKGQYAPGSRMFQLGLRALSQDSLVDLAWPSMERLVDLTGESVYLSVRGHAGSATYVATCEGTQAVRHRSWVGASIPLEGTAAGAALSGDVPPPGFAVVRGGVEADSTAVAVPLAAGDRVLAALSVVAPTFRCTEESLQAWGQALLTEARGLFDASGDDAAPGDVDGGGPA